MKLRDLVNEYYEVKSVNGRGGFDQVRRKSWNSDKWKTFHLGHSLGGSSQWELVVRAVEG